MLRKLIVDKACGKKLKILKPGEYIFSDPMNDDFFMDGVAIHAIVGKNGSGKSSLIEMLFRMSNNLAALMLRGYERPAADTIFFIEDVVAELHYEIDSKPGVLKCDQNGVELNFDNECFCWSTQYDDCKHYVNSIIKEGEPRYLKEMKTAASFFYTIATNYSVQSYIAGDFASEVMLEWRFDETLKKTGWMRAEPDNAWINSVFHKNDGYMSPLVLNPYRHEGKIDMEEEERLTTNRLSAILWETRLDDSSTQFIEGYRLYSLMYTFKPSILTRKFSEKILNAIDDVSFSGKFIKKYNQQGSYAKVVLEAYGYDLSPQMSTIERFLRIYLVYKTFRIADNYPSYSHFKEIGDVDNTFSCASQPIILKYAKDLVEKILDDDSHITLKIRQTRYLIETMVVLSEDEKQKLELSFSYEDYCKLLKIPVSLQNIDDRFAKLPPPFFKPDIFVVKNQLYDTDIVEGEIHVSKLKRLVNDAIHVNKLSSGERQFIFMSSTLVYHALNLKSVPKQERIAYRNICMVLDEIEICFHPEYQRTFINKFLSLIKRMKLNQTFGIDVLIATHSPFVLSDIPQGNVLYLDEGKNVTEEKCLNTFGANVNELLCHSFFLEGGFMGEFAKQRIQSLVNFLQSNELSEEWNDENARELIDLVGDEVIQYQLRQLYAEKFGGSEKYRTWIENEARRLGIRR